LLTVLRQIQPSVQKGIDRFKDGDLEGARRVLEKCVRTLPRLPDACFFLAQISYRKNDFTSALDWIGKAESGYRNLQTIMARLNQSMMKMDQDQKEKLSEYSLDLLIMSQRAQCSSDRLKNESNRVDEIAGEIKPEQRDHIRADMPVSAEYSYVHGNILFRMKRFPEAETQYLDVLRFDPRHVNAYNNLITLYLASRRVGLARQFVEQAERNAVSLNPALVEAIRKIPE
jgi:tetratricopeptide (TPR) repeat protein